LREEREGRSPIGAAATDYERSGPGGSSAPASGNRTDSSSTDVRPKRLRRPRTRPDRDGLSAAVFLGPWGIGLLGLIALPVVLVIYWSFTNFDLLQPPQWVGFANYFSLTHDGDFWQSVRNTIYITVIGVPALTLIPVGVALLVNRPVGGLSFHRTAIFLPAVLPPVAVALVWVWILNPDYGLLNAGLHVFGIAPIGWLSNPSFAKISLLMMVTWGGVGMNMIIFLAALKEIPRDLYEAAQIDGASPMSAFRHITLPMLSPVIFYIVVVSTVFFLQFFEAAFVVTANQLGAPANSTLFYPIYLYEQAFVFLHTGVAAAMAVILFVATMVITGLFFAVQRRFVFYAGGAR
jgi:multiple sugar transport system permease protein